MYSTFKKKDEKWVVIQNFGGGGNPQSGLVRRDVTKESSWPQVWKTDDGGG